MLARLLTLLLPTQTLSASSAFLTISLHRTVAHGVAIVKHGRNTASQQFTAHQGATGSTWR